MKTTTNTRNTDTSQMSQPEEKAMALMLHLGNPYFVCNGQLYQGTEEEAQNKYILYSLSHESFEDFIEGSEDILPVDASLDAIEAEGYRVCTESDQEPCKNVIDTQVINNTTYYICKRENVTNNADEWITVEIDKLDMQLLKKQKRFLLELSEILQVIKEANQDHVDAIEGMISLVDGIQDYAIDKLGMDKYEILDLTSDEEED